MTGQFKPVVPPSNGKSAMSLRFWQRDDDRSAAPNLRFDADVATMRFDDATDDGQAEAGSLGFRGA